MPTINLEYSYPHISMKHCYKCCTVKPIKDFGKRKYSSDGYSHECKDCYNIRHKQDAKDRLIYKLYEETQKQKPAH